MSLPSHITRRHILRSLPAVVAASRVMAQRNKPSIRVRALNHMTLFVSDSKRSLEFYRGLFGMRIQAHQGPASPLLAVGSGPQFLALGGGGANGATPRTPGIAHACLTM